MTIRFWKFYATLPATTGIAHLNRHTGVNEHDVHYGVGTLGHALAHVERRDEHKRDAGSNLYYTFVSLTGAELTIANEDPDCALLCSREEFEAAFPLEAA